MKSQGRSWKPKVPHKLSTGLLVFAFLHAASAWAQQGAQRSPIPNEGTLARIHCDAQPYVSMTADPEQSIPMKLVATLKCDEEVAVLSDPGGYTVKVRTGDGKVGYVSHFNIAMTPRAAAPAAAAPAAPPTMNSMQGRAQAQPAPPSASERGSSAPDKDSSKPRIYVSDTQSWVASGGFARSSSVAEGNLYGGYDPQLVDIYQDFTSDCPAAVVTQHKSDADYAVLFDKGSSKKGITGLGGLIKVNKVTVLSRSGETVFSTSPHSADSAVRDTCAAIERKTATGNVGRMNQ
jgi:hypothetical protein